MRRWGVVTGLIAGLVVALWVIALASSGSASAGATQIQTKTVTVAAANELRPGMRLTLPATYHSYRVTRFRWLRCDRQGASCRRIAGATRRVYIVRIWAIPCERGLRGEGTRRPRRHLHPRSGVRCR